MRHGFVLAAVLTLSLLGLGGLGQAQEEDCPDCARSAVTFDTHGDDVPADPCSVVWDDEAPKVAIPGARDDASDAADFAYDVSESDEGAEPEAAEERRRLGDDGRIHLRATYVRGGQGRIEARGDIVFVGPDIAACAERAEFDTSTATLTLTEGVRARVEVGGVTLRIWANRAVLNTIDLSGEILGAAVLGPGIRFTGGRLQREADGTLLADEVYLTPCECGPDSRPSWEIAAIRMKVYPSGRASFVHGRLRVKGVPVLFAPFGLVPLGSDRVTGILPPQVSRPGNDDYEIQMPLYLAGARWWDLMVTPIYNVERGFKLANQARYAVADGRGALGLVVGQDAKVIDDATRLFGGDRELARDRYGGLRWQAGGRFAQDLPADTVLRATLNFASDDRWAFDFGSTVTERSRLDYESNAFVHRPGQWVSVTAASTYFQDQRSARVQREFAAGGGFEAPFGPYESTRTVSLPARLEVSGPLIPIQLPGGPGIALAVGGDLAYDLAMNIASPREGFALGPRRFPGEDATEVPPRQAHRVTFQPLVALPIAFAKGGVSILSQAGARTEAARTLAGTSATRVLPFVQSDARLELGRTFRTRRGRLRHTIQPAASFQYVPASYFDGSESVASVFGPDAPDEGWTGSVSLANRVLWREVDPDGRRGPAVQIMDFRVGQRFSSDPTKQGVLFGTLRSGFRGFSLRASAQADRDLQYVDKASVFLGAGTRRSAGGIGGSYSFGRDPDVDQISASLWVVPGRMIPVPGGAGRMLRRLRLEGVTRYDLNEPDRSRRQLSVGGGFSYVSPCECWSISLSIAKDRDRDQPSFSFKFEPTVPRSTKRIQPLVAGEER